MNQVSNKKQRDIAAADAETKAKQEQSRKEDEQEMADADGPPDLLSQQEDKDVIF
jgi:V-type H+-transporting ATPase subunit D